MVLHKSFGVNYPPLSTFHMCAELVIGTRIYKLVTIQFTHFSSCKGSHTKKWSTFGQGSDIPTPLVVDYIWLINTTSNLK